MFVAYEISLDLNRALQPILRAVKRHDRDLAEQMRTAASSITLNIAEGARSTGGNQRQRYESAHGSAHEVKGALDLSDACGYVDNIDVAKKILDRQLALLWGLTHSRNHARR
jgi:four helix bundle protein